MALQGIDHITRCDQEQITAEKSIPEGEEYFVDHFPDFSIVPGVLMLEYLVQAAGWHVQQREGFTRSHVALAEVAHVKFSKLVRPPVTLQFQCKLLDTKPDAANGASLYEYQGKVILDRKAAVSARFTVRFSHLKHAAPRFAHLEEKIRVKKRGGFGALVKAKAA